MPVDLNTRYSNAWFEVNTRLNLRQNAISVYAGLMSFVVAGMGLSGVAGAAIGPWIALLVPLLSLLFALLVFMHDSIIRNLCKFIKECESIGNTGDSALPSYLGDAKWSAHDDRIRGLHHIVCAFLIIVFNGIAMYGAIQMHPSLFSQNSAFMWVQIGLAMAAVFFAILTMRPSKQA